RERVSVWSAAGAGDTWMPTSKVPTLSGTVVVDTSMLAVGSAAQSRGTRTLSKRAASPAVVLGFQRQPTYGSATPVKVLSTPDPPKVLASTGSAKAVGEEAWYSVQVPVGGSKVTYTLRKPLPKAPAVARMSVRLLFSRSPPS